MLDREMIEQLKAVFADLNQAVTLSVRPSSHPDQAQLLEMLRGLGSASPQIRIQENAGERAEVPSFSILCGDQETGIRFRGIPGGHEFSSLVLAVLNAAGKGKLPDAGIIARIGRIKGPIRLRTYISLTCENCPDVVQALNVMAILHPDFEHEMVDGAYVQDEVSALKIQGVPSVVRGEKLIHSGKIQFLDLLTKLEQEFGTTAAGEIKSGTDLGTFDMVVLGGGPAGASAAIYSVRKGLKTAILAERMGGQVQDTKGIENFISIPYTEGPQLTAQLAKHLDAYPVTRFEHRRVKKISGARPTLIELESGETLTAAAVIVATGAKWRELGVPGEKEYLGRGVAFCPHCDGPFYQGKKVAVVGGGNSGVEAAIDLAGITREVVVFEFNDSLKADAVLVAKLKSLPNVSVRTSARTVEISGNGDRVTGLVYQDRKTDQVQTETLDGVFVQIGLLPNSTFLKGVVDLSPFGEVIVDIKGRTSKPGIYAAGDVTTTPYKQIIIAMGEGAKAALAAFEDRMLA